MKRKLLYNFILLILLCFAACENYPDVVTNNIPTFKVSQATEITINSAVIHGTLTTPDLETASNAGFIYHKEGGIEERVCVTPKKGELTYTLCDLERNTTYYYSMFVNGGGESEIIGEEMSFRTYGYTFEDHIGGWMQANGNDLSEISYKSSGKCYMRQYDISGIMNVHYYGDVTVDKDIIKADKWYSFDNHKESTFNRIYHTDSLNEYQWNCTRIEDGLSKKYTYGKIIETIDVNIGKTVNSTWLDSHPTITSVKSLNENIAEIDKKGNIKGKKAGITFALIGYQSYTVAIKIIVYNNSFIKNYAHDLGASPEQIEEIYGKDHDTFPSKSDDICYQYIFPKDDPMVFDVTYWIDKNDGRVKYINVCIAADEENQRTRIKEYLNENLDFVGENERGIIYEKYGLAASLTFEEGYAELIYWATTPVVRCSLLTCLSDAAAWSIEAEDGIDYVRSTIIEDNDFIDAEDDKIIEYIERLEPLEKADPYRNNEYKVKYNLKSNTEYTLYIIGYSNDENKFIYSEKFQSPPSENQSYATLTDWEYNDNTWKININLYNTNLCYLWLFSNNETWGIEHPVQCAHIITTYQKDFDYIRQNVFYKILYVKSAKLLLFTWSKNYDDSWSGIASMKSNYEISGINQSLISNVSLNNVVRNKVESYEMPIFEEM